MLDPLNRFPFRRRRGVDAELSLINVNRSNFLHERRNVGATQDALNEHDLRTRTGHRRDLCLAF